MNIPHKTHLSPSIHVPVQGYHGSLTEILVREEASAVGHEESAHRSVQAIEVSLLNIVADASKDASDLRSLGADGVTLAQAGRLPGVVRVSTVEHCCTHRQGLID